MGRKWARTHTNIIFLPSSLTDKSKPNNRLILIRILSLRLFNQISILQPKIPYVLQHKAYNFKYLHHSFNSSSKQRLCVKSSETLLYQQLKMHRTWSITFNNFCLLFKMFSNNLACLTIRTKTLLAPFLINHLRCTLQ